MIKKRILAALLASCLGSIAAAEPVVTFKDKPLYWGLGYTGLTYSEDAWMTDANPGAVSARLGYEHSRMISSEVRFSGGVGDDTVTVNGGQVDVDIAHMLGVYGRINLLTDVNFSPYAVLGYTQAEAEGSNGGAAVSQDEGDFSYGVGIDFCQEQPVCLHIEYMSYLAKDNFDAQGYTVGFKARF